MADIYLPFTKPSITGDGKVITYEWALHGLSAAIGDKIITPTFNRNGDNIGNADNGVIPSRHRFVFMTHRASVATADTRTMTESSNPNFVWAYFLRSANAFSVSTGESWSNTNADSLHMGPCFLTQDFFRATVTFATAPSSITDRLKICFLSSMID